MSIGISGMRAATARLNASAANIANAQTTGALPGSGVSGPQAYQPVDVVQVDTSSGGNPGGVSTSYSARPNSVTPVYDPDAPGANSDGMVGMPDVDIGSELIQAMIAKYQFEASAKMVSAAGDMQKSAIDLLA